MGRNSKLSLTNDIKGGILDIPDGWFVNSVDFDDDEPCITICSWEFDDDNDCVTMLVPKSLAYYLSTHFCGSEKMRKIYIEQGKDEIRNYIKRTLKI